MADLENVAYCGLYCRLCSTMSRVPHQAAALRASLARDGWQDYGEQVIPGFGGFWSGLERLADLETTCPRCRGGCGDPGCRIRMCAEERGCELCPFCDEHPCEHIHALAGRYPSLIADGQRMRQIGVDAWIEEQETRRSTGFCYADTRFPDRRDV